LHDVSHGAKALDRTRGRILAMPFARVCACLHDTTIGSGCVAHSNSVEDIVKHALDGLEASQDKVLTDQRAMHVKQGLAAIGLSYLPQVS